MIHIKLSNTYPFWPLERQTPGRSYRWGDCMFHVNDGVDECDFWAVQDDPPGVQEVKCGAGRTLLLMCEPPAIREYGSKYINQFDVVLGCHDHLDHANAIVTAPYLPWWYGINYVGIDGPAQDVRLEVKDDYDSLSKNDAIPAKSEIISVISSSKAITPGHRERLEFVEHLKKHFGDKLHVYGKGINSFDDKRKTLAPYRYHIALENCVQTDYWTEKLADAYLGATYPFYHGCPNLERYFNADAFTKINIYDPAGAIRTIESTMNADLCTTRASRVLEARSQVLNQHNLFARLAAYCEAVGPAKERQRKVLKTADRFGPTLTQRVKGRLSRMAKRYIGQASS